MQPEKQQQDRYEIINVDGRILIRDNLESKTVAPACGLDALGYHGFLKNSQKHGNDEAQKFLGEIMVGGLPITEMRQKIQVTDDRHRSPYSLAQNSTT